MSEEFFIGWQGKAPEAMGRFLRGKTILLLILAALIAGAAAIWQGTIGKAYFEFGKVRDFSGILLNEPVPMLVANQADETSGAAVYYLVNPLKFGFDPEQAEKFHLTNVSLQGSLLYREDGQAMIEVLPDSVTLVEGTAVGAPLGESASLGVQTLRGEIVDSKCYLGLMNPGIGKPHRACAIRCISGGVPPVLLVPNNAGEANYFILVDERGGAVNGAVLDYVALPVEITGEALKIGDRLVLKADPSKYHILE